MNASRRPGVASSRTQGTSGRAGGAGGSSRGVESPKRSTGPGNPPSPGSPKRHSANQESSRRGLGDSGSAPMSRVSSYGEYKKEDLQVDPDDRRLEDERGLFHVIEQLAALEGALYSILDGLKSNATHVSYFCREYWGTSASQAQLSLEKLVCNERLKRQVQQACVLESLSLGVASHLCSGIMQGVSVTIRSRLRNLLYYIHENCLVLLDMVCQRWHAENPNHWAESEKSGHCPENLNLDILVRVKRYRRLRKGEHIMALRQHNEMISNVVRQLCRGAASKRPPLSSRGMGSPGDRSPGARGPGANSQAGVLSAVNDILSARMPLDRLRASSIRTKMLNFMRFKPLLNVDGSDPDCPWPAQDPYERYGAESFAQEGPVIWFEPLPPMLPDLERTPKLPPNPNPDVYTLVLDLDETLVHYFECDGMGNYGIRPGMQEFLQRMSALGYELVIFTAATQDYADWVIDQIDEARLVHHRLYRQNALPWGPIFVKDLSRLGRDLDRMLIIDNVQENFMLQPNNGIFIYTWYDDPHDTALSGLTPLLEELIHTRAKVPDIMEKYRDQIPSWAGFDRYDQFGEYDDFQGEYHDEDLAPPMTIARTPEPMQQQAQRPAHAGVTPGVTGPAVGWSQAVQQAPAGVESTGGYRSDAPTPTAAPRQEASPPSSPPAGGNINSYTTPAMSTPIHQTPSAATKQAIADNRNEFAGQPMQQGTGSLVPHPQSAPSMSMGSANTGASPYGAIDVGTGPAVSSSYVGAYLPQRTAQAGYPQVAKAASPAQQVRPAAVRQAQHAQPAQIGSPTGPQRTLAQPATNQAGPQRAVAPQVTHGQIPQARQLQASPAAQPARQVAPSQPLQQAQSRPAAPAFSSVSGPLQSGPPQPRGAPTFRSGLGPHQAPPPQAMHRR